MPDYKKMYFHLFNEVSDVIEALKLAQQETEKLYIASDKADITVLQKHAGNNEEKSQ